MVWREERTADGTRYFVHEATGVYAWTDPSALEDDAGDAVSPRDEAECAGEEAPGGTAEESSEGAVSGAVEQKDEQLQTEAPAVSLASTAPSERAASPGCSDGDLAVSTLAARGQVYQLRSRLAELLGEFAHLAHEKITSSQLTMYFPTTATLQGLAANVSDWNRVNHELKLDIEAFQWRFFEVGTHDASSAAHASAYGARLELGRGRSATDELDLTGAGASSSSASFAYGELGRGARRPDGAMGTPVEYTDFYHARRESMSSGERLTTFHVEANESRLPRVFQQARVHLQHLFYLLKHTPQYLALLGPRLPAAMQTRMAVLVARGIFDHFSADDAALVALVRRLVREHFYALDSSVAAAERRGTVEMLVRAQQNQDVMSKPPRPASLWAGTFLDSLLQAYGQREECHAVLRALFLRIVQQFRLLRDGVHPVDVVAILAQGVLTRELADVLPRGLVRICQTVYQEAEYWCLGAGVPAFNAFFFSTFLLPALASPAYHGLLDPSAHGGLDRAEPAMAIALQVLRRTCFGPVDDLLAPLVSAGESFREAVLARDVAETPGPSKPVEMTSLLCITLDEMQTVHRLVHDYQTVLSPGASPLRNTLRQLEPFLGVLLTPKHSDTMLILQLVDPVGEPLTPGPDEAAVLDLRTRLAQAIIATHDGEYDGAAGGAADKPDPATTVAVGEMQALLQYLLTHSEAIECHLRRYASLQAGLELAKTYNRQLSAISRRFQMSAQTAMLEEMSKLEDGYAAARRRPRAAGRAGGGPAAPPATFEAVTGLPAPPQSYVGRLRETALTAGHTGPVDAADEFHGNLVRPRPSDASFRQAADALKHLEDYERPVQTPRRSDVPTPTFVPTFPRATPHANYTSRMAATSSYSTVAMSPLARHLSTQWQSDDGKR